MNEFDLIKNYFAILTKNNPSAKKLNDDVFFNKKKQLVVSVDTYNEKVHFLNFKKPDLVIKKVLRSSISDLISKGVKPRYYFISGSGNNKHFSENNLKLISKSLNQEQKKYNIQLSGGDTTKSNTVSFSLTSIGFSKNIIQRNKAKINDDIYVTGNIGDSYVGLKILNKNIKVKSHLKNYFEDKYYCPNLPYSFSNYLYKFANSSMDISDGIISDMFKLINNQKLSFKINLDKIPVSKKLIYFLNLKNLKKENFICHGDDYQILFTASKNKRSLIKFYSKKMNQKVTIIGRINDYKKKNIVNKSNIPQNIRKFKGYSHKFS